MNAPTQPNPADLLPEALSRAGSVVERSISYLLEQDLSEIAIASALLGGALGLLAKVLDDAHVLKVLENAADSVRAGELDALRGQAE